MPRRMMLAIGSLILTLILGLCALVLFQPEWLFISFSSKSPQVVYSVDIEDRVLALTIDDGPDALQTPKILDVLKMHDAHATFFLIGSRIPGNEEVVRRIVDEGHEIANHLMFDEPSILLSPSEFERQLTETNGIISEFADVHWIRPGSGWYNEEMISIADRHDYQIALGSIYPYDPQLGSAWFSAKYVLWKAHSGSIVVLHDYQRRGERTAIALETILPELSNRGFQVVTLSDLVGSNHKNN